VQFERVTLAGDPTALAQELRGLVPAPESVTEKVAEIIARVRANGDDALRYYTRQFDTGGSTPSALRVPAAELDTAAKRLPGPVGSGLDQAITNVMRVCDAALGSDQTVSFVGHEVT
jgi:histidinol dehydrogenase